MRTMGAILDTDHFRHMTGDDRALQQEIILLFRGQAQLWRRLIIPDAPVHTWRDAVHSLKGSARGLGLWRLAEACEAAEASGTPGAPAAPAATPTGTATPTATPSPTSSLGTITISPAPGNYVISAANPTPVISGTVTELVPGATEPAP